MPGNDWKTRSATEEMAVQMRYLEDLPHVGLSDVADDLKSFYITTFGTPNTPYEFSFFILKVEISDQYPRTPPTITFENPIFHPNVFENGKLCWSSDDNMGGRFFMDMMISAIDLLMLHPNPNNPANAEAARLFIADRQAFNKRAQEIAEQD
jgi:ubiquitin-protein ligase